MRNWIILLSMVIVVACGGGSGGGPSGPPPPPAGLTISTGPNLPPRFIPAAATTTVGRTVTWRNGSPVQHNVTSDSNAWTASRDLNPGQTFQVTFPQAGVFDYHCTIHPGMSAVVVVR